MADLYRTWREFAKAASVERDSDKLAHLVNQLNRTLEEEEQREHSRSLQCAGTDAA